MYRAACDDVCSTADLLRQFVLDLQSGKLHREFHMRPDDDSLQQVNTQHTGKHTAYNHDSGVVVIVMIL